MNVTSVSGRVNTDPHILDCGER